MQPAGKTAREVNLRMGRAAALPGEQNFEEQEGFAGWVGSDDAGADRKRIGWVGWDSISWCVLMRCGIKILKCTFGGKMDVDVADRGELLNPYGLRAR